jgi:hypothetical protein
MGCDTTGDINYISSTTDGDCPWIVSFSLAMTVRSNFIQTPVNAIIHDLRGKEDSINLDTNAVEVVKYNGSIQEEFEEGSEAQKRYFEEISNFLQKKLGASRVIIFSFAFRSRTTPFTDEQSNDSHRNPAFYPHVDNDPAQVQKFVEEMIDKEEGEKAKRNRIQVLNIWRPLGPNPITNKPLAICDYTSVDLDKDVLSLKVRGKTQIYTGYTMSCNAQHAHKWYYMNEMRSDEMFLFKMYDSKPDVAQLAFHTAFNDDNAPLSDIEQKSVEIRCLISYND